MYKTIKRNPEIEDVVQSLMNYNNYNFLSRNHFMVIIDSYLFMFRNDNPDSIIISKIESYEVNKDGLDCTINSSKNNERFSLSFDKIGFGNNYNTIVSFNDYSKEQMDKNYNFYNEYKTRFGLED